MKKWNLDIADILFKVMMTIYSAAGTILFVWLNCKVYELYEPGMNDWRLLGIIALFIVTAGMAVAFLLLFLSIVGLIFYDYYNKLKAIVKIGFGTILYELCMITFVTGGTVLFIWLLKKTIGMYDVSLMLIQKFGVILLIGIVGLFLISFILAFILIIWGVITYNVDEVKRMKKNEDKS